MARPRARPRPGQEPSSWLWAKHRDPLAEWLGDQPSLVALLAADELADIAYFGATIYDLQKRITKQVKSQPPQLLALPGCGPLSAAKISAETGEVTRFRNEAAFARHAGVAPTPRWSGADTGGLRAARSGNRQLNQALHKIAIVQVRMGGPGQVYYRRRVDGGDTSPTALRCLKRKIARVVYRRLLIDSQRAATTLTL